MTMGITSPTSTTGQILKDGTPVISFDANNNATFAGTVVSNTPLGMRNRIINGAMDIDQRNAGASYSAIDGGYSLDRWKTGSWDGSSSVTGKYTVQQNAGSVTPPVGFANYLGVTSSTTTSLASGAEYIIQQLIEGYNMADLGWGTANAQTVTLSFWVRSSLTGTFGGSLLNSSVNYSYPFSYTIASANTWEKKTITISGPTSGTWVTTNGIGIRLLFSLGVGSSMSGPAGSWSANRYESATGATNILGTSGATFYITGVQLEIGTSATPFERRLYNQELQLCQRYYEKSYNVGTAPATVTDEGRYILQGSSDGGNNLSVPIFMQVSKRTTPTFTGYIASTGASGSWFYARNGASGNATVTFINIGTQLAQAFVNVGSAWVTCYAIGHWVASAEL